MAKRRGGSHVQRGGPHVLARGLVCLLLALLTIVMIFVFARRPEIAPPGVLAYLFLAVPILLMLVLLLGLFQELRRLRSGRSADPDEAN